MKNQIELLAPAGSYDSMVAAINAGADAVYIGGDRFGARAYVDKLDEKTICKAIDYVHIHGKKLYLTVNTLLKQEELYNQLYDYLLPLYKQGIDAVLVQDLGVFNFIKRNFPGLDIHASTQMNISGVNSARLLQELGATRVVTARELSLEEIKQIHDECDIEIESFVHGALCYCYSGECLFSSLVGGRSGNRGRCAQPCRLPYDVFVNEKKVLDQAYILSLKDLNVVELLPKIIESGVSSLKIEGRMKKPEYVAGAVSIYRKYIDLYLKKGKEKYKVSKEDIQILFDLFNRNGFTKGYYDSHNSNDMVTIKKPEFRVGNDRLIMAIKTRYLDEPYREQINGRIMVHENKPLELELKFNDISVKAKGDVPSKAQKQPINIEGLKRQIKKMGDTQFELKNLEVELDEDLFVPIGQLNELRRSCTAKLEKAILEKYKRKDLDIKSEALNLQNFQLDDFNVEKLDNIEDSPKNEKYLSVSVEHKSQLESIINIDKINCIYVESSLADFSEMKDIVTQIKNSDKKAYLAFPYAFRQKAIEYFDNNIEYLKQAGFDGFLIRNLESLGYIKYHDLKGEQIIDHPLYTFNTEARYLFRSLGASMDTIPLELNDKEIRLRGCDNSELVVYGYMPMMITANCIKKNVLVCDGRSFSIKLQDRLKKIFTVKNFCKYCYNIIYNSSPLSLLDKAEEIKSMGINNFRLSFTIEEKIEVESIVKLFVETFIDGQMNVKNIDDFTRGHYKRGVE